MINLAGVEDCNKFILSELIEAEISISRLSRPSNQEVSWRIYGRMGDFKFTRAWRYWVARGPMPIEIAREIYIEHKSDVRHSGHCACPHPDEWAHGGFIGQYHIDTQVGLNYFIRTLKKYLVI